MENNISPQIKIDNEYIDITQHILDKHFENNKSASIRIYDPHMKTWIYEIIDKEDK